MWDTHAYVNIDCATHIGYPHTSQSERNMNGGQADPFVFHPQKL